MALSAEKEIAKLKKLLKDEKEENKAIREAYEEELTQDKKEYDKRCKAMYEFGYQQALEDMERAEKDFEETVQKLAEQKKDSK